MKFDLEKLKDIAHKIKKRHLFLMAILIFGSIFIKQKFFSPNTKLDTLLSIKPSKKFSVEEIENEEKIKVFEAIKEEESKGKGVGRDIFFSNLEFQKQIPQLTGIMIGSKKIATFSNGEMYTVGDDFFGNRVEEISSGRVVLVDNQGEQKILKVRGK